MPDIAVGAVFCQKLIKHPKDENNIHLQTYKGMAAPLYHKAFEYELSNFALQSMQ